MGDSHRQGVEEPGGREEDRREDESVRSSTCSHCCLGFAGQTQTDFWLLVPTNKLRQQRYDLASGGLVGEPGLTLLQFLHAAKGPLVASILVF